ncbi:molybdopterin molybdenumtransferase MoeA [Saccharibacter sp. 17.LH.SD]|nr:molybdopterin molybdenumtransferase MoeA [Saccharibacter sp. 17.LH.SD]
MQRHGGRVVVLLQVEEAEKKALSYAGDFGIERVSLEQAIGRVLREDIKAERDQPPYNRVMMDGIALRYESAFPLECVGLQPAGQPPMVLEEGRVCVEVTTGSVLPEGADCVVPIEHIHLEAGMASWKGDVLPQRGQFIHLRGADRRKGDVLLSSGQHLTGPALAVLAANGMTHVHVSRLPAVAILVTGDELVEVEASVQPWQIRRSNDYAIMGMLRQHGIQEIARFFVHDDAEGTLRILHNILDMHDVVVISGGVSMGPFDFVPRALEKAGVQQIFHKIAQRPGGPLWFGQGQEGQRVFGLPGNPVSAMVCMARYVLPLLTRASGGRECDAVMLRLTGPVSRLAQRTRFVPVQRRGRDEAVPCPVPTSGDFMTLAHMDGIVELSPGDVDADIGEMVRFYGWS